MSDRDLSRRRRRGMRFRPAKGMSSPSGASIWGLVMERLFRTVPTESFYESLNRFSALDYKNDRLVLGQTQFGQTIELHAETSRLIQQTLSEITGRNVELVVAPAGAQPVVLKPEPIRLELGSVNSELLLHLNRHPECLHDLSPRRFEEVVAEILSDMGYEVELTPQTRDGGRDILAALPTPLGKLLVIVECKRYALHRKIGIDTVERFLWVIDRKDNASCGLIAATTHFSPEAETVARQFQYRLKLHDFDCVKQWVANYGKWTERNDSGLWLPRSSGNLSD